VPLRPSRRWSRSVGNAVLIRLTPAVARDSLEEARILLNRGVPAAVPRAGSALFTAASASSAAPAGRGLDFPLMPSANGRLRRRRHPSRSPTAKMKARRGVEAGGLLL